MINRVFRNFPGGLVEIVAAGIQVAVPAWEIGARDLQANAMSGAAIAVRFVGGLGAGGTGTKSQSTFE